jgi:hypothetical protein
MKKPRSLLALLLLTGPALFLLTCRPQEGREADAAQAGGLSGRLSGGEDLAGAAVVWLQGAPAAAVPEVDTVITHVAGGRFEPPVSIGFVGNEFVFKNEDDSLHTTHLYLHLAQQEAVSARPLVNGATLYNIALPIQGMEVRRPIDPYASFREDSGVIDVKCNPHPDEKAALLVFDHPYATMVAEGGTFSFPDAPAGTYALWTWHEGEARERQSITLEDGAPLELVIELE